MNAYIAMAPMHDATLNTWRGKRVTKWSARERYFTGK